MLNFSTDQWIIVLLVFLLGLLVGGFLFSGGGRKWKTRYNTEVDRRAELERTHVAREQEWREQDSLRAAAIKNRPAEDARLEEERRIEERRIADRRGGDRDHDGTPDSRDPVDDRKV